MKIKKIKLYCFVVFLLIISLLLFAVQKTGQDTSYLNGDDGSYKAGEPYPAPRFIDNKDGTVTDRSSGLIWQQNPSQGLMNWSSALSYANNLTVGTNSLWRLPNINELASLINLGEPSQSVWLNANGFTNIQGGYYWTSTTYAGNTVNAWYVDMIVGEIKAVNKNSSYYVIAVSSGL